MNTLAIVMIAGSIGVIIGACSGYFSGYTRGYEDGSAYQAGVWKDRMATVMSNKEKI